MSRNQAYAGTYKCNYKMVWLYVAASNISMEQKPRETSRELSFRVGTAVAAFRLGPKTNESHRIQSAEHMRSVIELRKKQFRRRSLSFPSCLRGARRRGGAHEAAYVLVSNHPKTPFFLPLSAFYRTTILFVSQESQELQTRQPAYQTCCIRQAALGIKALTGSPATLSQQTGSLSRFFAKASTPASPAPGRTVDEVAKTVPRAVLGKGSKLPAETGKLEGSLLPPPHIPGIRRAPREPATPRMAGMEGRMPIRLPAEGTRFRKYIDPRADYFFPLTAAFVAVGPLYMFSKAFF
ncbi:hypothetical protein BESB_033420 [Besnoitia besnoiti]|uniref:Transmembrane protein n=1 Tax=Besnoitia besnoiti TaxID=94643 RepID=A0A2A9MI56_BESBE|nr:hypothetical protein BESB_033420 [Besnoitia besnoiti]PFH36884.1 hypothetical protein BESB_033420 [Besnoitia besnoiti]